MRQGFSARADEPTHVLLIERDRGAATMIIEMLRASWHGTLTFTHVERVDDARQQLLSGTMSAILLDHQGAEQYTALEHVRMATPDAPIVVLGSAYSDDAAVNAIRDGAQDFLAKPDMTPASLRSALLKAIERKRSEVQLTQRALQDPLTGLPNRTLFIDRLGVALDRARRKGGITGVLFLDVDQFKQINDSLGHAAGDRVLVTLADRLRTVLRPMDTVARFGGDEFTFLFEDLTGVGEAVAIAERVRHAASVPIELDSEERRLNVSIGVATATDPHMTSDELIRAADEAMYQAKEAGGGGHELSPGSFVEDSYPPISTAEPGPTRQAPAADRRGMQANDDEEELRGAVEHDQLRVFYQPRYALGGARNVAGFEALVRWQHPERGLIAPGEFLELAEQTGIVVAIGEYVLREALHQIAGQLAAHPGLTVSVNLSRRQLAEPRLVAALGDAVRSAGVDPGALCIEINEATVSEDLEGVIGTVRELKAAGVGIAIDDYSAGSVTLRKLGQIPADSLKIHQSLIAELGTPTDDGTMVSAVVELAHALGMSVVAEGVETESQLDELRSLGCDSAQGYLLCRPVGEDQLREVLTHAA
jgi:diguanylate cyclase (GGDEF)-like protein